MSISINSVPTWQGSEVLEGYQRSRTIAWNVTRGAEGRDFKLGDGKLLHGRCSSFTRHYYYSCAICACRTADAPANQCSPVSLNMPISRLSLPRHEWIGDEDGVWLRPGECCRSRSRGPLPILPRPAPADSDQSGPDAERFESKNWGRKLINGGLAGRGPSPGACRWRLFLTWAPKVCLLASIRPHIIDDRQHVHHHDWQIQQRSPCGVQML